MLMCAYCVGDKEGLCVQISLFMFLRNTRYQSRTLLSMFVIL